jgi:predicted ATPase/class 3 adenylate cyclase
VEGVRTTELPSGTVTFLFTDVEGSTRLWEEHREAMRQALARHDQIVREAIGGHGGFVFSTGGDGFGSVFARTVDALGAAREAQAGLAVEVWPEGLLLKVRMGIHTGEAEERGGDYFGPAVNRAARLMALGHGGQTLCSSATAEMLDGAGLVDLGMHRLRDLSEPVRVFQVGDGVFSPLRSLENFPGNLPLQLSSFVGREKELSRVAKALEASRVVTLTGVGGVGKTRLALQTAAEVLPSFPDGAWLCELASVRDPDMVVDAVAGVFRVTARPGLSLLESLVGFLRDQTLLLVLDNCEHLLRAVARLVVAVEAAGPGVRVLATSREGLNVAGEQLFVVPSLGLPEDDPGLDAVECESVRLFAERARLVKADFEVDGRNQADVVAVCTRLDGVALAIELAAARIPAMTPSELLRRLDRRFRLLSGGGRVAIERHQTLRATIDWSYELLSEPERRLLDRLAVFAGGFTLEAVEAVCAGDLIDVDEVFDLLAGLVARSLVVANAAGSITRYRLLETIRQYAEERLAEAGETDVLRARHADYFIDFAASATQHIYGPGQLEWGARLAGEHDNFQAAMAFALASGDVNRAMALLCQTPAFINQADQLVVFDSDAILAIAGASHHPGSSRALLEAGQRQRQAGDYQAALQLAEQAEATLERLGPAPGYEHVDVLCLSLRAEVAVSTGQRELAVDLFLEGAERERDVGRLAEAAIWLGAAANTLAYTEPATAARHATDGLELARRSGMPIATHTNLLALANTLVVSDSEQARQLLHEALDVHYDNAILATACFTAGRLEDWPTLLRATGRLLQFDRRTATTPRLYLAGIINFVARALAASQPEAAAVLQGTVPGLTRPADSMQPLPSSHRTGPGSAQAAIATGVNVIANLGFQVRRDTTRLLIEALGQERVSELRARGEAMDYSQTCGYALDAINRVNRNTEPPTADRPRP